MLKTRTWEMDKIAGEAGLSPLGDPDGFELEEENLGKANKGKIDSGLKIKKVEGEFRSHTHTHTHIYVCVYIYIGSGFRENGEKCENGENAYGSPDQNNRWNRLAQWRFRK
ncbi:hypothetical protein Hdeb2414_s0026g00680431 [Helianthus debilis subsp. tardiflorus]